MAHEETAAPKGARGSKGRKTETSKYIKWYLFFRDEDEPNEGENLFDSFGAAKKALKQWRKDIDDEECNGAWEVYDVEIIGLYQKDGKVYYDVLNEKTGEDANGKRAWAHGLWDGGWKPKGA
jgi:hypothetical protein